MTRAIDTSPGTVSKILWHFTGGPRWDSELQRQQTRPKPAPDAYAALRAILRTRTLKLGAYREVIRGKVLNRALGARGAASWFRKSPVIIESSPVCCLADIPIAHLKYHSHRYGKFAIGFHRESAIEHGFNPVLYALFDKPIVQAIYISIKSLSSDAPDAILEAADSIDGDVFDLTYDYGDLGLDVSSAINEIENGALRLQYSMEDAEAGLRDLLSFVKTFEPREFASVYCEREWRSTRRFVFTSDDVAMIVLPREVNRRKYFVNFVRRSLPSLDVPRDVPVIPWEDLVEH